MSNASDFIIKDGILTKYIGGGGDVIVPEGVVAVDTFAFENCALISKLILPKSLTEIREQAFVRSYIERVFIPQVKVIEIGAFEYSTELVEVILGAGVEEISDGAFSNCSSLSNIVFSKQLIVIGYCAFSGCSSIKCIEFPESLKHIGQQAFEKCKSLESITLPQNIEVIENGAFSQCQQITALTCNDDGLRLFLDSHNAKNLFDVTYKLLAERLKTTASVDEKFIKYVKKNHEKIFPIIAESDNEIAFVNFVKYAPPGDKKTIAEYTKIAKKFSYAEHIKTGLKEYGKTHKLK